MINSKTVSMPAVIYAMLQELSAKYRIKSDLYLQELIKKEYGKMRQIKGTVLLDSSLFISGSIFAHLAEVLAPELIGCLLVQSPAAPQGTAPVEEKTLPKYLSLP